MQQIQETNNQRFHIFFIVIAAIGLIFSLIWIIQVTKEHKHIKKDITNIVQANEAINNHQYEKALSLISGTQSEDYYNRATIQTLLAYTYAGQNTTSGTKKAQILVAQAKNNFDIAKTLGLSSTLSQALDTNHYIIEALSAITTIKHCYLLGNEIITAISDIITTLDTIKDVLAQEEQYVEQKAKDLPKTCYQKLASIVDTSKEQVGILQMNIIETKKTYLADLSKKIDTPQLCIDIPYQDITPIIKKGNEGLKAYQQLHQNTITALASKNKKMITELCEETKNDAQLNQHIQNAIHELVETLAEQRMDEQKHHINNQKNYKELFGENEKEILKNVQKINEERIQTLLKIRSKMHYDPRRYLNNIFNQFYGNTGDFVDLHK